MIRTPLSFLFFLLLIAAVWNTSSQLVDPEVSAKWYALWPMAASCALFLCIREYKMREKIIQLFPTMQELSFIVLIIATAQAIYAILQRFGLLHSPYAHTVGSFDNPAGLASVLAFSMPFCLSLWQSNKKAIRGIGFLLGSILFAGLIVSDSRTGILAAVGAVFIMLLLIAKKHRRMLLAIVCPLLIVLSVGLYYYKKDSADGRKLIWQCTLEMIREHPLMGYGPSGFKAHYMDFQARHFEKYPADPTALLADNIKWPFSEYLQVLVSYGLLGAIGLTLLIVYCVKWWKRSRNLASDTTFLCLVSIALFSVASYPFFYAHTWVFFLLSLAILFFVSHPYKIKENAFRKSLWIFTVSLCVASFFSLRRMQADREWECISDQAIQGKGVEVFPRYEKLRKTLWNKPTFLYNYAAELNIAEEYKKSISIALECEQQYADYDLQLVLADSYRLSGQHRKAEMCYQKAAMMCPNCIAPYHELYFMYKEMSDSQKAICVARNLFKKALKVPSPEVLQMRCSVAKDTVQLLSKLIHKSFYKY
ncbi:MAG: O-antigen ligase family protein [Bacteroidaceae bacterium]|nr:O-antigen ligase family protein [Bacteroidaceae bacterium]MBP9637518.1 O-antigen ligase family protein [Bacteroidaceae bacterium]